MSTWSNVIIWPGVTLDLDRQTQLLETDMLSPDPDWKYVDKKGHGHFWSKDEVRDSHYPTLKWISLPCSMGHGDECTAEGYYQCRSCKEKISPGRVPTPPELIVVSEKYTLTVVNARRKNVYVFDEKRYRELQIVIRDAIEVFCAPYLRTSTHSS